MAPHLQIYGVYFGQHILLTQMRQSKNYCKTAADTPEHQSSYNTPKSPIHIEKYPLQQFTTQSNIAQNNQNMRYGHQPQYSLFDDKIPINWSYMQSSQSGMSAVLSNQLPRKIDMLEADLTQQILGLKEDKITLMEQHNQLLCKKYELQREVRRLCRQVQKEEQSAAQPKVILSYQQMDKIVSIWERLRQQHQELEEIDDEIRRIKNQCQQITNKLSLSKSPYKQRTMDYNISSTYCPKQKRYQLKQHHQVLRCRKKQRNQLYASLANTHPASQAHQILAAILQQNQQLQYYATRLLKRSHIWKNYQLKKQINALRYKVECQEKAKSQFMDDLIKFKHQMNRIKQQNSFLRSEINGIRYYTTDDR